MGRQDFGDAAGKGLGRRQVEELVGTVGVGARAQDAGDEELGLGKALTQHAHEGDGDPLPHEHRFLAEIALRRPLQG